MVVLFINSHYLSESAVVLLLANVFPNRRKAGLLAVRAVATASPVIAANQRLPPLSTEPNRCERAFVGNTIGQANGVYDKPLDLRFCDYSNEKSNLKGKSLAAALMSDAKFDGADMSEAVMSKAYAVGASFKGNLLYLLSVAFFEIIHLTKDKKIEQF
ncbi:hypothetical protein CRYUN_Cryun07bG0119600 [Craigia yunnanensis]